MCEKPPQTSQRSRAGSHAAAEPERFRVIDAAGPLERTEAAVRAVLAAALELAP